MFTSEESICTLQQLKQLQHLDLSEDDPDDPFRFGLLWDLPLVNAQVLEQLLSSLPNIKSLDLSGELSRRVDVVVQISVDGFLIRTVNQEKICTNAQTMALQSGG